MKTILVALDASPAATAVLDYAAELALRTGAKLALYRAVQAPFDFPAQALAVAPAQLSPLLIHQAHDALKQLAARCPAELVTEVTVEIGTPWREVCHHAREIQADLIVIGSHAYGALDRLLGTTAARIVNHADGPVLVVRHPEQHPV